jgi:hypothetical protein
MAILERRRDQLIQFTNKTTNEHTSILSNYIPYMGIIYIFDHKKKIIKITNFTLKLKSIKLQFKY